MKKTILFLLFKIYDTLSFFLIKTNLFSKRLFIESLDSRQCFFEIYFSGERIEKIFIKTRRI
jgi:hypothetical protein